MASEYFVLVLFFQPVKQLSKRSTMPFSVSVTTQPSCISFDGWRTNLSLLIKRLFLLITIKLFCFINGILELRNVAVLIKNKAAVAFVDFITEVVAATFIAVVTCANLVAALCVLCAIGFSFVQCEELRNLVALDVVVPIYAVFLHNIDLTVMSRAE